MNKKDIDSSPDADQSHTTWQSVDELQSQGINVQDINKLKATGICTILAVSQTTRRNLLKIKGLSEAKVEKLKEAAAKMLPPTFATAAEIGLRRECCVMITTGSKTVDAMLGGGFPEDGIVYFAQPNPAR